MTSLSPFEIAVIHPDIPQNTGNIGRLCVALDLTLHVVHPMGFVIDHKQVRRAGLDYWKHVRLVEHPSLEQFLLAMSHKRMWLFSTKGKTTYTSVAYKPHDVLVFGAETTGLPDTLLKQFAERVVTIPMTGPVRSLNVSNCAAVAAYEAYRQVNGDTAKVP